MKRKLVTLGATVLNSMRRLVGNALCWAFGHKVTWYESGFEVCDRCHKHAYHCEDYYNEGRLRIDWWVRRKAGDALRARKNRRILKEIENGTDVPF